MQRNILEFKVKQTEEKLGEATVYEANASTIDIDRDGEIVVPYGGEFDLFEKNPLLLGFHDRRSWPIGKVVALEVDEKTVGFKFVFADTDDGRKAEYMYKEGFMNSFSIGFAIKQYISSPWETEEVVLEYAKGKITIPVKKMKDELYGIISKWELREISAVTVPANPYANLKKSLMVEAMDRSDAEFQLIKSEIDRVVDIISAKADEILHPTGVVRYEKGDISQQVLTSDRAVAQMAKLYARDKLHDQDWGKYSKGFTLVNLAKAQGFSGYLLPHHYVEDEGMMVSMPLVKAAMVRVLSNELPDWVTDEMRKGAYEHLALHYADAGILRPDFEDCTPEEAMVRAEGKKEESDPGDNKPLEVDLSPVMEVLKEVRQSVGEMAEDVLSLNIKMQILEDKNKVSARPEKSVVPSEDPDEFGSVCDSIMEIIKG